MQYYEVFILTLYNTTGKRTVIGYVDHVTVGESYYTEVPTLVGAGYW